jgi:hypothetical protein
MVMSPDSGQPVARSWARWCRGASLAPKDSIGAGLTSMGSPRRPTDGEEDSGREVVVGSADERVSERNLGLVSSRG